MKGQELIFERYKLATRMGFMNVTSGIGIEGVIQVVQRLPEVTGGAGEGCSTCGIW